MLYAARVQCFVHGFIRRIQEIFRSAADPQEIQLLIGAGCIGKNAAERSRDIEIARPSAAKAANIGESIQVAEANLHRLAAAHRQARDCAMRAFQLGSVGAVDLRNQVANYYLTESFIPAPA